MTLTLRPYPAYKDSGLSWLGAIPAHWDERRAKYFFREIDERSSTGQEELLSVSHVTGVTPRSQKNVTMFMAESHVGHKRCRSGDLVINTMWAWMAALGVARQKGIVSPSYSVYRPIDRCELMPDFVDELLRTQPYAAEYVCRSTGIRSSRLRLYPDQFLEIPILRPPLNEQKQIVSFLSWKDLCIRRFIRAKRRQIALLNEQKQAIIHQAVTRGLDPSVPLKPSGVEWLGDVPAHWEVTRVKNEFECLNHRRIPLSSVERGAMTSRKYDYYGASGVIDKVDEFLFDDDLLLIAEDGANLVLRNLALAIIARGKFWVNNHAHILKPKRGDLQFLANLMEALDYRRYISGAAQPKLTQDRLMSIQIPIPPIEEQKRIMAQVDVDTCAIVATMDRAQREIDLIREYRTRLVADVVTGKLDVRGVELPALDEADGVEEWDEEDGSAEDAVGDDVTADSELVEADDRR